MKIKIHHILLLIFSLALVGCGEHEAECNYELPATWGCESVNGEYECGGDKVFALFEDTIGSINAPIKSTIETLANQVLDSPFSKVVSSLLLLYITLYGAMLAGGLVNATMSDAIVRIMKVTLIALMFTEAGIQLYFDVVVKFAIDGGMEFLNWVSSKMGTVIGEMSTLGSKHEQIAELMSKIQGAKLTVTEDKPLSSGAFVAVDYVIGQLVSPRAFALYTALIFTLSATKIFMGICLLAATFFFLLAIFRAVYIYIVSLLGRVFLLGLGGIFIIFLLFARTQQIFLSKWFQQLLGYMFAPVFVFTFISLLSVLVNIIFLDMVQDHDGKIKYAVCREEAKKTSVINAFTKNWEFAEKKGNTWVIPDEPSTGVHTDFFTAMVLLALAFICWQTIPSLDNLSTQLFGVLPDLQTIGKPKNKSLDLGHNVKKVGKIARNKSLKTAGKGARGAVGLGAKGAKKAASSAKNKWRNRNK